MADPLNWDEFRIVKAIAETQSLAGAGERLGLNHSTMFRRLTALEARLGLRLFDRDRSGYRRTAAGEDMVALATLMGGLIAEFEHRCGRDEVKLTGQVRLTTNEALGCLVLPPLVAEFRAANPGLQLDLILTDALLDLSFGVADLALRAVDGPLSADLTGRRLGVAPWGVYAAASVVAADSEAMRNAAPWVLPTENFRWLPARRWLESHVDTQRQVARASGLMAMAELAARGLGLALLPCFVANAWPGLRRVGGADPGISAEIWLVTPPQSLRMARIRATFDFFADELEKRRALFQALPSDAN